MNVERILRLADFIETAPDHAFDMGDVFGPGAYDSFGSVVLDCGTAACIAGWGVAMSILENKYGIHVGKHEDVRHVPPFKHNNSSFHEAGSWLGLNTMHSEWFDNPSGYNETELLTSQLFAPPGYSYDETMTNARAAAVLRYLAETGEVHWAWFDMDGKRADTPLFLRRSIWDDFVDAGSRIIK